MTDIPKDGYFGRGEKRPDNEEIYPFKIDTPSSVLDVYFQLFTHIFYYIVL